MAAYLIDLFADPQGQDTAALAALAAFIFIDGHWPASSDNSPAQKRLLYRVKFSASPERKARPFSWRTPGSDYLSAQPRGLLAEKGGPHSEVGLRGWLTLSRLELASWSRSRLAYSSRSLLGSSSWSRFASWSPAPIS